MNTGSGDSTGNSAYQVESSCPRTYSRRDKQGLAEFFGLPVDWLDEYLTCLLSRPLSDHYESGKLRVAVCMLCQGHDLETAAVRAGFPAGADFEAKFESCHGFHPACFREITGKQAQSPEEEEKPIERNNPVHSLPVSLCAKTIRLFARQSIQSKGRNPPSGRARFLSNFAIRRRIYS